jgi:hypothetical protein
MAETAVAAVILNPQVVGALIDLLRSILDRSSSSNFRTNLKSVQVDLGFIKDVLEVIEMRNRWNLTDGIRNWEAEAQGAIRDTETLLRRINDNNMTHLEQYQDEEMKGTRSKTGWWSRLMNRDALNYSSEDADELENLRNRLDRITNQNTTVLALLRETEDNTSECGCCML